MRYRIELLSAAKNLFKVELDFIASGNQTIVQIPYWRPGRYEAGNFPRNFIGFTAKSNGKQLDFEKITPHRWAVNTIAGSEATLSYELYASPLTAGNTYCDEQCALINPVNALVYILGEEATASEISLKLPGDWNTASALPEGAPASDPAIHSFRASGVQHLMDSPILAAADLRVYEYTSYGISFKIHVSGYVPPSETGVIADFKAFTDTQIAFFNGFPYSEFHFLLLFMPEHCRHGVEHEQSTVILMGPAHKLDNKDMYNSLLSISSHELYHCWNVKYIRPYDWSPYNFEGPSPSRLAYIAEGVTTYMGDWMLWQAGVFTTEEFMEALSAHWHIHNRNEGRHQMSLGDASIDTWTDGYGGGAPERRVSIYTEGALFAFVCDALIVEASNGKKGLWSVMRKLYAEVDPNQGYTEEDFWATLAAECPTVDWTDLRDDLKLHTTALVGRVNHCLNTLGMSAVSIEAGLQEKWWGQRTVVKPYQQPVVSWVKRNSPAEAAGLWYGDELISVDGMDAGQWLTQATEHMFKQNATVIIKKGLRNKQIVIKPDHKVHGTQYVIKAPESPAPGSLFELWHNAADNL